ncbi:integrase arm-type DNA-binding domain-containing protein [Bradyrhizobium pachyrhizi]|uniref:tyrosine-type recombinase/integrase n=1 Tax=Bradyrhizobium pachyrhizi TaxID=280333 RepID=UPI0024B18287|nr:integrase arm-type DNA-binding domain-containing protein [Bradyrhizobium pachyrhizi]WFU52361.1 integrase arm-type DNA-binding domain-containing protein [Bradyrhizobium pachyrhizi]
MKKRLTDIFLKTAKADKDSRLDVFDSEVPGLMLRITESGTKTFSFKYKIRGTNNTARVTIGAYPEVSLEDARETARGYRADIRAGNDPRLEKIAKIKVTSTIATKTFEDVCHEYIESYSKPNLDSWKNDEQLLRAPRAKWGNRPIKTLTDDEIMSWLEKVAKDTPVQANRTQSKLFQVFKWAKLPGRKYVDVNPLADLPLQGQEHPRERVLDDSEIKMLWHGLYDPDLPAEDPVRGALRLILSTMVRPGQAAGAMLPEMQDFKGKEPQWHIPKIRVKKRREVIVPINGIASKVMEKALREEGQIALFPTPFEHGFKNVEKRAARQIEQLPILRNSISQALTGRPKQGRVGIREFLKMEHFTPHDLRRTAATIARRAGAPRDAVKATLDHVNGDVTAVYDKYDMLKEKTDVQGVLASALTNIIGDKLWAS